MQICNICLRSNIYRTRGTWADHENQNNNYKLKMVLESTDNVH